MKTKNKTQFKFIDIDPFHLELTRGTVSLANCIMGFMGDMAGANRTIWGYALMECAPILLQYAGRRVGIPVLLRDSKTGEEYEIEIMYVKEVVEVQHKKRKGLFSKQEPEVQKVLRVAMCGLEPGTEIETL